MMIAVLFVLAFFDQVHLCIVLVVGFGGADVDVERGRIGRRNDQTAERNDQHGDDEFDKRLARF